MEDNFHLHFGVVILHNKMKSNNYVKKGFGMDFFLKNG